MSVPVKFLLVFLDMDVYILHAVIPLLGLGEQPFTLRSFSLHRRIIAACRSSVRISKLGSRSIHRLLRFGAWIDVGDRSVGRSLVSVRVLVANWCCLL
jgi:hypothetical protein